VTKRKAKTRKGRRPAPNAHHLDRRASTIANVAPSGADDELLSTKQVAVWFGCSEEWLEVGRNVGYGPEYTRLGPRLIRYTRGKCREYLQQRMHQSTAEYAR
jgi:hypothetical protein